MNITLHLLQEADAEELFDFELKNRNFFEKMVPSRGEEYYLFQNFKVRHHDLLNEQQSGLSTFFLIKNEDLKIIGRINVFDIDLTNRIAEIGFRIGEAWGGKGIGKQALHQLVQSDLGLNQLKAKTTTANNASQKILEQNGFVISGIGEHEFELNGQQMKFIHYLREM